MSLVVFMTLGSLPLVSETTKAVGMKLDSNALKCITFIQTNTLNRCKFCALSARIHWRNIFGEYLRFQFKDFYFRHSLRNIFIILSKVLVLSLVDCWLTIFERLFFRNLNIFLRKICKIVLFKVLLIWNYNIFPSFWLIFTTSPFGSINHWKPAINWHRLSI